MEGWNTSNIENQWETKRPLIQTRSMSFAWASTSIRLCYWMSQAVLTLDKCFPFPIFRFSLFCNRTSLNLSFLTARWDVVSSFILYDLHVCEIVGWLLIILTWDHEHLMPIPTRKQMKFLDEINAMVQFPHIKIITTVATCREQSHVLFKWVSVKAACSCSASW